MPGWRREAPALFGPELAKIELEVTAEFRPDQGGLRTVVLENGVEMNIVCRSLVHQITDLVEVAISLIDQHSEDQPGHDRDESGA